MANSNSEHSKNLRRKQATKRKAQKLASGEYKQISIVSDPQTINFIKEALANTGMPRAKAIKFLCLKYENDLPKKSM